MCLLTLDLSFNSATVEAVAARPGVAPLYKFDGKSVEAMGQRYLGYFRVELRMIEIKSGISKSLRIFDLSLGQEAEW